MNNFHGYFRIINEAFSQWEYKLPEDKEQQLFDFYMLVGLQSPKDNNLKYAYNSALKTITDSLQKKLKSALLWAICAEFRHIFDRNNAEQLKSYFKENKKKFTFFKKYTTYYRMAEDSFGDLVKSDIRTHRKNRYISSRKNYFNSYKATKKALLETDFDIGDFIELCRDAFIEVSWPSSYGGKPWSLIAGGWLMLDAAGTLNEKIIAIDHAYDLQHNTDTVFNKLQTYYKERGQFNWIADALDKKRDLVNVYEIYDDISSGLRPFVAAVIKDTTGETLELWRYKQQQNKKENIKDKSPSKLTTSTAIKATDPEPAIYNFYEGLTGRDGSKVYKLLDPTHITYLKDIYKELLHDKGRYKKSLILKNIGLTFLPKWLDGARIFGGVDISNNELKNLKSSPLLVYGGFFCTGNPLSSLEGISPIIDGEIKMPPGFAKEDILNAMRETARWKLTGDNPWYDFDKKHISSLLQRHKRAVDNIDNPTSFPSFDHYWDSSAEYITPTKDLPSTDKSKLNKEEKLKEVQTTFKENVPQNQPSSMVKNSDNSWVIYWDNPPSESGSDEVIYDMFKSSPSGLMHTGGQIFERIEWLLKNGELYREDGPPKIIRNTETGHIVTLTASQDKRRHQI